ncbi:hypothetical protein ACVWYH_003538 [Bradyrhizobium sp. GM24.11]
MLRIVLFLVLIALAGAGAAWVVDQPGDVVLTWGGFRASPSIPVFVLCLGIFAVLIVLLWSILTVIWRMPGRMRRRRHDKRHARGRHAITHGLLAIGHGDTALARRHAEAARSGTRRTIRSRFSCTRNRPSSTAIATRRSAPFAPWPSARILGCSACAACSSRRSAPTMRLAP